MPNSNKCEGCAFWEGNESTYRAKCTKNSDEKQNVTTAFDESCSSFFARAPKPQIVIPDMQSNARGIYSGWVGKTFTPDAYGDLMDVTRGIQSSIQVSRELLNDGGDWIPKVFADRMLENMRNVIERQILYGEDRVLSLGPSDIWDCNFIHQQEYYPLGSSPLRPLMSQMRVEGKTRLGFQSAIGLYVGDNLNVEVLDPYGNKVNVPSKIVGVKVDSDLGVELEFVSLPNTSIDFNAPVATFAPLDDEDEDDLDEDDDWDDDEEEEEPYLHERVGSEIREDDEREEDEGYGGNRRFYL